MKRTGVPGKLGHKVPKSFHIFHDKVVYSIRRRKGCKGGEAQRVPGIISIEKRLRWNFNSPPRNLAKKMGTGIQTPIREDAS